jgi:tetratricopeptide (TPR) repeat protein
MINRGPNWAAILRGAIVLVTIAIVFVGILVVRAALQASANRTARTEAERAVLVAEEAVKSDPNDARARANLAAAYLAAGRYSDASKQAEYAIRLNPDEGTGYLVAGIAARELGRYEEAINFMKRALEDQSKTADWYMKAYAELARTYEKANRLKEAKKALDGALGYFPEGADLYYERARITEKLKDYKNAILDYQAVLTFDPTNEAAKEAIKRLKPLAEQQESTGTEKKK